MLLVTSKTQSTRCARSADDSGKQRRQTAEPVSVY